VVCICSHVVDGTKSGFYKAFYAATTGFAISLGEHFSYVILPQFLDFNLAFNKLNEDCHFLDPCSAAMGTIRSVLVCGYQNFSEK